MLTTKKDYMKIINGEEPSYKIYEDDNVFSCLSTGPYTQGHTLIIPKVSIDHFIDVPDTHYESMVKVTKIISKALLNQLDCRKIQFAITGRTIPHTHFHLLPSNSLEDIWKKRETSWLKEGDMIEIQEKIVSYLNNSNHLESIKPIPSKKLDIYDILDGKTLNLKVYEDNQLTAYLNSEPNSLGHMFIIPKIQVEHFMYLPDDIYNKMFLFAKELSIQLKNILNCNRIQLLIACRESNYSYIEVIPSDNVSNLHNKSEKPIELKNIILVQDKLIQKMNLQSYL